MDTNEASEVAKAIAEKIIAEKIMMDEPGMLAVDDFIEQQMKLAQNVIKSPLIGENPLLVLSTLLTMAQLILEMVVLVDSKVFNKSSKEPLIKMIEDLYEGKTGLCKKFDEDMSKMQK